MFSRIGNTIIPESFYQAEDRVISVSPKTKKLWACLLQMLMEMDRVCTKHGIQYAVDGGTLLGAMRHNGFIPWDDDVDIIITRAEYTKLCAVAHEIKAPYFLQNKDTDLMAARGHAQLRNSETTAIMRNEMENGKPLYSFNQGVFLDIFILDNLPDDEAEANAFMQKLQMMKRKIWHIRYLMITPLSRILKRIPSQPGSIKVVASLLYQRLYDATHKENLLKKWCDTFDNEARKYEGVKTKRFSHLTFMPNPPSKVIFDCSFLENIVRHPFEMISVPVPARAEDYLNQLYGNWHVHVVGASSHGGILFDLDRPYTDYL